MKTLPAVQGGCARLLCLLCCLLVTQVTQAAIDVLDRIDVTPGEAESTIHIRLNIPVRYKSHAPERSGDVLRIVVEPVPTPGAEGAVLLGSESIQWSPDDRIPLFEVRYEGEGFGNTTLTLRFQENVEFDVPPSPDFRSLIVTLKHKDAPVTAVDTGYRYVINMASSLEPFEAGALPDLEVFRVYRVYTTRFLKTGTTWNRLRLGFFRSRADAAAILEEMRAYYPDAWLAEASPEEIESSSNSLLTGRSVEPVTLHTMPPVVEQPPVDATAARDERLASMMEEARQKMVDKDYSGAIRLYTKALEDPENRYSQDALEFMGLARERKNQLAQAKAVYDDYLQRYPEGEGAERIRQRLAGLLTARKAPRDKLRTVKDRSKQATNWDVFGGFSQFYRRDENTITLDDDNELTTLTQSSLASDLDITGRLRTGDYDLRTRLTGGYLHDFLDDGSGNDSTVSSLYFDARNKPRKLSMRLGRQSRSTGGVLGRFDGLLLGAPLGKMAVVNAVAGFPVNSSSDSLEDSKYFYGMSLDFEDFAKGWDANAFLIEQRVDSIVDRRAVGGEVRYFDIKRSFFSLVDYDIHYNELNIVQLLGNWTAPDKTTVNFIADYRKSPILTTSNALQGQVVDSIDSLLDSFTEDEIREIARDRTGTSKLFTLGASHPVNDKFQVSGDVTLSNFSGTDASAGVEATEGTGNELFYNLQLIGSNLLKTGDIAIFGLRYIDARTTDTTSLSLNTRYPVSNALRVNPRLRVDLRKNRNDSTEQVILRPSLRLTYRVKRRFRLEGELGGEWSDRKLVASTEESNSYFLNVGYRVDF